VPKFAKRFLILLAVFLAAAGIILLCINLYLQSKDVQQRIHDAAIRSLGAEVKIGSTNFTPWNGLVVRNITVPDPQNAALNMIEAKALRIRFAWFPLLERRFVVTELALFEPKIFVRQTPGGDWLIPVPPSAPLVSPETLTGTAAPKSTGGKAFRAELEGVHLRDGQVAFINAKGLTVLFLEKAEFQATIAPDLSAQGVFEVERLDLSGRLRPHKISGPFTWNGSVFDAPNIEGSLAGGKIIASYRVMASPQPSYNLNLRLDNIELKKLFDDAYIDPGQTEGRLQGMMNLAGDPRSTNGMTGGGHMELLAARLKPLDFLVQLGTLLQIEELQLLKLNDAKLDFTVKEEKVWLDNLTFKSENLVLKGQGPIRFNGKMDLAAKLQVNRKLQKQLKSMLNRNFVDSDDPEYKEIAFTVTGKIDNPQTNLLDKLTGIENLSKDVGGLLKNLFRSSPTPPKKNKKATPTPEPTPEPSPAVGS
jgi:AsmA-like C-terminal region